MEGRSQESWHPSQKNIADWCEIRKIHVQAVYLPGNLNVIADEESRASSDSSDWMLEPRIFSKIKELWPIDIDLF